MNVLVCNRCAEVTIDATSCRCTTPLNPIFVLGRHHDAVARAQTRSGGHTVGPDVSLRMALP